MQKAIVNENGVQVHDQKGNALKLGQLVIDNMFGEGEVRGTEPLEKGAGVTHWTRRRARSSGATCLRA